jgi:anti-anti-sigma factor
MLRLTIRNLGDATIFRCEGRIVLPEADALRVAVLTHPRIRLGVLDLSGINVIDAAGLGTLVSLRAWSGSTGTRLKLMNLNPRVEYLLELTHLKPLFDICSVGEMLELFCRAFQQSRFVQEQEEVAAGVPARLLDDTGPISIEAQGSGQPKWFYGHSAARVAQQPRSTVHGFGGHAYFPSAVPEDR